MNTRRTVIVVVLCFGRRSPAVPQRQRLLVWLLRAALIVLLATF